MSERAQLPLALKYRPKVFADLVGQDSIVTRLKGILASKKIPNAILLVGPSGCGKTTTARMLATYLNCKTLDACGTCPSCLAMAKDRHPDYKEINAATTRGIDDVRALINESKYKPQVGNFRIIAGDEIQQLTPQAQQAMLKPIEEPPEQTIWILSSMEPEKMHTAMTNRCQTFYLKLIDKDSIIARLRAICNQEKVKSKLVKDDLLESIANLSNGHMRHAIQMLESVIQYLAGSSDVDPADMSDWLKTNVIEATLVNGDDNVAAKILLCLYIGNSSILQRTINDASDYIGLCSKLVQLNTYVMDKLFFEGKHRNVWDTYQNKGVWELLKGKLDLSQPVFKVIAVLVQNTLIDLRKQLGDFILPEKAVYSGKLQQTCQQVKALKKA